MPERVNRNTGAGTRVILGFVSGFVAVLLFHQVMLGLLKVVGLTDRGPFPFQPTAPFGIPQVVSAAFWGGLWGIILAFVERKFGRGSAYWTAALLFGALALSLVAWFVVLPLKGQPAAGGWDPAAMAAALLVNGAWGVGTAMLLKLLLRRRD